MSGSRNDTVPAKGVLILGMHRSGTSALTRLLNLLGADLSSVLWRADEANKKGFWEDPRVFGIHDEMLHALGRTWEDLRELPEDWLESSPATVAREKLVDLLRSEFSASRLWMVKDPRICRLLPLWKQIFEQIGASMQCVLAVRHPDEVALSLKSRNEHAVSRSRLAWLEHTADSVLGSQGFSRVVVTYDQLMTDWEAVARRVGVELGLAWPREIEEARGQVNEFLSRDERHHHVVFDSQAGKQNLVERLFDGLLQASAGEGWHAAETAAHIFESSRRAFLDALNSEQERFDSERMRWAGEMQALSGAFEQELSMQRQESNEKLVAEIAGTVHGEVEQLGSKLADQWKGAEAQLQNTLRAQSAALATMLYDMTARMDALQATVDSVKPAQEHIAVLQENRQQLSEEVRALRSSSSWRITAPLRLAVSMLRRPRSTMRRVNSLAHLTAASLKQYGVRQTARRIVAKLSGRHAVVQPVDMPHAAGAQQAIALPAIQAALPATERLSLRVLLIAELSLPQCRRYRVVQKQQMLEMLGIDSTVVSWTDLAKSRSLLQTHSVAIFYRVPGFADQLQLIREAKALGVQTFWEVDDIIFDAQKNRDNTNLAHLDEETRRGIMFGIPLYRAALIECGAGIASTDGLADAMREAGVTNVSVLENALDGEALRVAAGVDRQKLADGIVRIVYGSGSRAHDADFRVAASGIRRVLEARPNARLIVIGELNLPEAEYQGVMGQVERFPATDYATYMRHLAMCDITIAPLEDTAFNDAKSNIKFLEGAIVHLPSVCSPRAAFRKAIQSGMNGYLADNEKEWEEALLTLIDDAALRESVARKAYEHALAHYALPRMAEEQLEPIFRPYEHRRAPKLRVLGVNIFFAPRSYGGATIVAEEVMKCINQRDDIEYAMFTTLPTDRVAPYEVIRYSYAGGDVFAMGLPPEGAPAYAYNNPHSVIPFTEVLHAYRPDIVHLHSVQGIGVRIIEACVREKIPFTVTLHDAWWICERQFMLNSGGHYCHQRKVDLDICASCISDRKANRIRQNLLHETLQSAAMVFSPSEFSRQLHLDNGFDPARLVVNKNGVMAPRREIKRAPLSGRKLRLGFVGGEGPLKGSQLIRKALRSLKLANYELHVVDNELNLGRRSIDPELWQIPGTLKVVPAYTQKTIDEFFESIDVLLFPTQSKESFGLTVREALIRDVWVITTDAGGVVEDIVSGENGDVIPLNDDGTQLAAAIGRLLEPSRMAEHRNPHAGMIRLFDAQATEICGYFKDIVAKEPDCGEAGNDAIQSA